MTRFGVIVSQILQILFSVIELYKKYKLQKRSRDIRTKPADEWLRKFGGQDERDKNNTSPNTKPSDYN